MLDSINDFVEKMSGSNDYTAALTTLLVLIIILIVYLVVFKLGVTVIGYMMDWKGDPYIIRGREKLRASSSANHYYTNPLDHTNDNVRVILRSNNERNGIEFTWATWLYIDANEMIRNKPEGTPTSTPAAAAAGAATAPATPPAGSCNAPTSGRDHGLWNIFNKGSHLSKDSTTSSRTLTVTKKSDLTGLVEGMAVMTCPGLYLRYSPTSNSYLKEHYRQLMKKEPNKLGLVDENEITDTNSKVDEPDSTRNRFEFVVTCNTMNEEQLMETVSVPNIPLNMWTYVVIRCTNYKLDVYINGRIKKRVILSGLPRQNYGDLWVSENIVGETWKLSAEMSDLRYFNYALQARTIEYFTEKGPNLDEVKKPEMDRDGRPYYLTQRWHYTDYLR